MDKIIISDKVDKLLRSSSNEDVNLGLILLVKNNNFDWNSKKPGAEIIFRHCRPVDPPRTFFFKKAHFYIPNRESNIYSSLVYIPERIHFNNKNLC